MRHILSAQQYKVEDLNRLFIQADKLRSVRSLPDHHGKIVATLFFEPSTRTRLSFESAALRLGAGVIGTENGAEFSSSVKGETIEDTVKVVANYADVIVIRHPLTGTADRAAKLNCVPIINAGDGAAGEHPTQALLDLYTMQHELANFEKSVVVFAGDLKHYRATRSLATLLSLYPNIRLRFVSPKDLRMDTAVTKLLSERGVEYEETTELQDALPGADVAYVTRIPKEYFPSIKEYEKYKGVYKFTDQTLRLLKPESLIMHPLPRVDEIDSSIDDDPRAAYFRQVGNGLYIRMALLDEILSGREK
jgi:aspartate carbamoyltransferase catalytic subunit